MGRFFNEYVMELKSIPGKTTRKNNILEEMRVKYNESICCETSTEDGAVLTGTGADVLPAQDEPKPIKPRRTRRISKGSTRKARNNK